MRREALTIFVLISLAGVYGDQCTFEDISGVVDKVLRKCPRYYNDPSKSKCCIEQQSNTFYCCTEDEYSAQLSNNRLIITTVAILGTILVVLAGGIVIWCWYRSGLGNLWHHQGRFTRPLDPTIEI